MGDIAIGGMKAEFDLGFGVGDIDSMIRAALAADRAERAAERRADALYIDRLSAQGTTDASGDLTIAPVNWTAPLGKMLNYHRIVVDYAGSNPASPVSTNVSIRAYYASSPTALGDEFLLGSSVPSVYEWSNDRVAPVARTGETVAIVIKGGPASTLFTFSAQVTVTPEKR